MCMKASFQAITCNVPHLIMVDYDRLSLPMSMAIAAKCFFSSSVSECKFASGMVMSTWGCIAQVPLATCQKTNVNSPVPCKHNCFGVGGRSGEVSPRTRSKQILGEESKSQELRQQYMSTRMA